VVMKECVQSSSQKHHHRIHHRESFQLSCRYDFIQDEKTRRTYDGRMDVRAWMNARTVTGLRILAILVEGVRCELLPQPLVGARGGVTSKAWREAGK
jgi:hypothetical protein